MGKEETAKKRTQIVAVYEADGKWKEKARELQVPISTAYRWVNQGDHEDRRGGRRFTKVNQEHRDFMVTLIENNPRITLKEMAEGLKAKFSTASADFSLSKTAISSVAILLLLFSFHITATAQTAKQPSFLTKNATTVLMPPARSLKVHIHTGSKT